jgi:hypothetical protein
MNPAVAMNRSAELIPELQKYYSQVEEIKRDTEDLARGLSEAQFNWRPGAEKWSIGECLEHLNITARLYWPIIAEAITNARVNGWFSPGPYKRPWLGSLLISLAEPPPKMRFKAPRRFRPPADMAFQDRLLDLIRDANGVDLGRPKIHSPATKLIKITLGQSFGLITAHERRHLWQARQVRDDLNFPK